MDANTDFRPTIVKAEQVVSHIKSTSAPPANLERKLRDAIARGDEFDMVMLRLEINMFNAMMAMRVKELKEQLSLLLRELDPAEAEKVTQMLFS